MNWETLKQLEEWKEALKSLDSNDFAFRVPDNDSSAIYRYKETNYTISDLLCTNDTNMNFLAQALIFSFQKRQEMLIADIKEYMQGHIEELTEAIKEQIEGFKTKEEPTIITMREAIEAVNKNKFFNQPDIAWRLYEFIPRELHNEILESTLRFSFSYMIKRDWVRDEILHSLKLDLIEGFKSSIRLYSLASSINYWVVRFWLFVLKDDEFDNLNYTDYGLPFFKAVAEKYGFPMPEGV
jgi:hypothetical protein